MQLHFYAIRHKIAAIKQTNMYNSNVYEIRNDYVRGLKKVYGIILLTLKLIQLPHLKITSNSRHNKILGYIFLYKLICLNKSQYDKLPKCSICIFLNMFSHIGLALYSHSGQHAQNLYLKCTFSNSQVMQIQNMQQVNISLNFYVYKN